MWTLEERKVLKVTPALAKKFRDMEPAPGDRALRDNRVEKLKKAVIEKQFRSCEWASAYCEETKQTYRVNGKHTSTLMAELNGEAKGIEVVVEHFRCKSLTDVAKLYSTFDTRESVRTNGDINASFAGTCRSLKDIPQQWINLSVTGWTLAIWGPGGNHPGATERAEMIHANADFIVWMHSICAGEGTGDQKVLKRGPVAAAMFKTYEKDKKAATEFWAAVRDGSGTDFRSPDRKLNKILLSSRIRQCDSAKAGIGRREMYVKCLHAWNAWRRGASTDLKYFQDADDPKVI